MGEDNKPNVAQEPSAEELKKQLMDAVEKNRQLYGANVQLANQNKQLVAQIQSIDTSALTLKYLFKVLDHEDIFDPKFVLKCTEWITDFLSATIAEPEVQEDTQTETKEE